MDNNQPPRTERLNLQTLRYTESKLQDIQWHMLPIPSIKHIYRQREILTERQLKGTMDNKSAVIAMYDMDQ